MRSDVRNTSLVCAVRNRNAILEDSLRNWLRFDVPEIVIVDFRDDSCERVWDIVRRLDDPRVKLVETTGEYHYHRTVALNLAFSQATHPFVLKLDADYILQPRFFELNQVDEGMFVSGGDEENHSDFLTGLLYVRRTRFEESGGYHEKMFYYGFEDRELSQRLGLRWRRSNFKPSSVYHKPHSHALRLASVGTFAEDQEIHLLYAQMALNRLINQGMPWNSECKRVKWRVVRMPEPRYAASRDFTK